MEAVEGGGEGEGAGALQDGFVDGAFVAADVGGAEEDGGVDGGSASMVPVALTEVTRVQRCQ